MVTHDKWFCKKDFFIDLCRKFTQTHYYYEKVSFDVLGRNFNGHGIV